LIHAFSCALSSSDALGKFGVASTNSYASLRPHSEAHKNHKRYSAL